jgi:hypothetical protein
LIAELVKWENSRNETVLGRARSEIAQSIASSAAITGVAFALLERGVIGSFHHIGKERFDRRCDEFSFWWHYSAGEPKMVLYPDSSVG